MDNRKLAYSIIKRVRCVGITVGCPGGPALPEGAPGPAVGLNPKLRLENGSAAAGCAGAIEGTLFIECMAWDGIERTASQWTYVVERGASTQLHSGRVDQFGRWNIWVLL